MPLGKPFAWTLAIGYDAVRGRIARGNIASGNAATAGHEAEKTG